MASVKIVSENVCMEETCMFKHSGRSNYRPRQSSTSLCRHPPEYQQAPRLVVASLIQFLDPRSIARNWLDRHWSVEQCRTPPKVSTEIRSENRDPVGWSHRHGACRKVYAHLACRYWLTNRVNARLIPDSLRSLKNYSSQSQ